MRQPAYGHLPLVLATGGSPLSKREGAASLTDLREQGFLPGAIANYLVRLGHACGSDAFLSPGDLPRHFDLSRTSKSAARFDEAQLRHWQREAVMHASVADIDAWLGSRIDPVGQGEARRAFVAAVKGNVLFPSDADALVAVVMHDSIRISAEAAVQIAEAGPDYFATAQSLFDGFQGDFKGWTRAIAEATGRKGAQLFMPLRSALTGDTHGPELAPLVALMGAVRARGRLASAQERAAAT
jgi:glutamyl-tRNA synthetase